jgi:hypothetical protein
MAKQTTRDVIVGTRLTTAQARAARRLARAKGVTFAQYVANAIAAAVAHDEATPERLAASVGTVARRAVTAAAAAGGGGE